MRKPAVSVPDSEPPKELVIIDDVVGEGAEATPGSTVSVHYVGVSWSTGEQFDAWLWFEETRAVTPLPGPSEPGVPDTWPFAE